MSVYIIIFFSIIAFLIFIKCKITKRVNFFLYLFTFISLTIFIGLRHQVGGDWGAFLKHFKTLKERSFRDNLLTMDPGYVLLEYISYYLGLGIYGVNTLCGIIFLLCFFYFIKTFNIRLPYALLIAYPYLIMVVVNGYSRQGVAIGLGMVFWALLYKDKVLKSVFFLILSALFHKTALILSLLYIKNLRLKLRFKYIISITISCIVFLLFFKFFQDRFEHFINYYFIKKMHSTGAIIRILINILAGMLLVIFSKQYKKLYDDYNINFLVFIISVAMLCLAIFQKTTTVADRLLLYFYPVQIIIFPRILYLLLHTEKNRALAPLYLFCLISLYTGILFVWLLFAVHRNYWIPYDNLLFHLI